MAPVDISGIHFGHGVIVMLACLGTDTSAADDIAIRVFSYHLEEETMDAAFSTMDRKPLEHRV